MILTENGVLKLMQRIKSFITSQLNTKASSVHTHSISEIDNLASQLGGGYSKSEVDTLLNGKANSSHTHTKSQITDFPTIPSKTSELTNDSGFLTSHQDLSGYVPRSGGAVISGTFIGHTANDAGINYGGGTNINNCAYLTVMGKDKGGYFNLVSTNGTNNYNLTGYNSGILTWSGNTIGKPDDTGIITLSSGTDGSCGGQLNLYGKNHSDHNLAGAWLLQSFDGTNRQYLVGYPSGDIINHGNGASKHVAFQEDTVPRRGGYVMSGQVLGRSVNTDGLRIDGGNGWKNGASVIAYGKDHPDLKSVVMLLCSDSVTYNSMYLYPSGTWTWTGTAVQITSDKRLKQQISNIDDKLLDAWQDVTPLQFKYNDAVEQKGNQARLHTGYVVQQINEACQKHNIDISEYGLYCHEEYPERTEEVEVEQDDGSIKKETKILDEASEHYSLRYTETLVVECAYLRRENTRLKERLSKIEKLLNI